MGNKLSKKQVAHLQELDGLVRKANFTQKQNGLTVLSVSQKEIAKLILILGQYCPSYPEEGSLKINTWQKIGNWLHEPPRAPSTVLTTWKAIIAAITIFNPDSPSSKEDPDSPSSKKEQDRPPAYDESKDPSTYPAAAPTAPASEKIPQPLNQQVDKKLPCEPQAEGQIARAMKKALAEGNMCRASPCRSTPDSNDVRGLSARGWSGASPKSSDPTMGHFW